MSAGRLDTVHQHARALLTHEITPIEGARRLAALSTDPGDELGRFASLASDWELVEHTCARDDVERRILEEASLLVADTA